MLNVSVIFEMFVLHKCGYLYRSKENFLTIEVKCLRINSKIVLMKQIGQNRKYFLYQVLKRIQNKIIFKKNYPSNQAWECFPRMCHVS